MELAASGPRVGTICTCGTEISYPEVYNTGVRPNERAAERLRYRAFRAAGLVKNLGGFAIGMALLGLLFFPLALCGAVLGVYTLTMIRGPLGRYSGRRAAIAAVAVGTVVFATEGGLLWSYLSHRRADRLTAMQASAADDLRTLLRTERLYKAAQDRFGSLKESRFSPRGGRYTIYIALDDFIPAVRDGETVTDRLPSDAHPKVSDTAFTAFAVANLDGDPDLDVWMIDDTGELRHLENDVPWLPPPRELSAPPSQDPDAGTPPIAAGEAATDTAAVKTEAPVPVPTVVPKKEEPKAPESKKDEVKAPEHAEVKTTPDKALEKAAETSAEKKADTAKAAEPAAPKPVPFKLDKPPLGNPSAPPIKPPSADKPAKPATDPEPTDKPATPT